MFAVLNQGHLIYSCEEYVCCVHTCPNTKDKLSQPYKKHVIITSEECTFQSDLRSQCNVDLHQIFMYLGIREESCKQYINC